MKSFLSQVVSRVLEQKPDLSQLTFIVPNQRAGVYISKYLKEQIQQISFFPEIITFENFVEQIVGIKKTPPIELLFLCYQSYKNITPPDQVEPFHLFINWAKTLLDDFNDIDNHIVDTQLIFDDLKKINLIHNWDPDTRITKAYLLFLQKLAPLYENFQQVLRDHGKAYQGMLYREATEQMQYFATYTERNYVFAGFGLLKKAEQFIIEDLINENKAQIFWDYNQDFITLYNSQSVFEKTFSTYWEIGKTNHSTHLLQYESESKNIEIVGVSQNMGLAKYMGYRLVEKPLWADTALILSEPNILTPLLQSLPPQLTSINVTMGIPLKDFQLSSFIQLFFKLHIDAMETEKGFYFKNLLYLFQHPIFQQTHFDVQQLVQNIQSTHKTYYLKADLQHIKQGLSDDFCLLIDELLFEIKDSEWEAFIISFNTILVRLKDFVSELDLEVLYIHYQTHIQLLNWIEVYAPFTSIKTLYKFYQQMVFSQKIQLLGEPLQGLQIMGFLEAQVLDFEQIFLLNVNEGVLPKSTKNKTYIPFDIRKKYQIPTTEEDDLFTAFLFFRLLQRAEKVTLVYNEQTDTFGSGELSRFAQLLLWKFPEIHHLKVGIHNVSQSLEIQEIKKNEVIIKKIENWLQKGVSPSAISSYLYNPIAFYKRIILNLSEELEVSETIAENTLGTVVHETLEYIYKPFIHQDLDAERLKMALSIIPEIIDIYFKKNYPFGNIKEGMNRLIIEIAILFVQRFIKSEIRQLQNGHTIHILDLEKQVKGSHQFDSIPFLVHFRGFIDRIDLYDGVLRIIDFKTGKVQTADVGMSNYDTKIKQYKYSKSLQLMLYAFMYLGENPHLGDRDFQAGIYSFKNHQAGFIPANYNKNRFIDVYINKQKVADFMIALEELLLELLDVETSFLEK